MKNKILILLFSINIAFSQGINIEGIEEFLERTETYPKEKEGLVATQIPSKYDLVAFVPPIGNQKDTGSCVGWSTAYYTLSTIYNQIYGITDVAGKTATAFDPWFLYNQVAQVDYMRGTDYQTCLQGVHFEDAFNRVMKTGSKRMLLPPYDLSCKKVWDPYALNDVIENTRLYSIKKYYKIEPRSYSGVRDVKRELYIYKRPVIIGIAHYGEGLRRLGEPGNNGIFQPNYSSIPAAHAMAIVGYDDYINGGSFLVVNSYGESFGQGGYMWMSYRDFGEYTIAAFAIETTLRDLYDARLVWDNYRKVFEGEFSYVGLDRKVIDGFGLYYDATNQTWQIGEFINGRQEGLIYVVKNNYYGEKPIDLRKVYFRNGSPVYGLVETSTENDPLEQYLKTMFKDPKFNWVKD